MGNVISVALPFLSEYRGIKTCMRKERFYIKVSAQANFAHFCIIFSGCFMDNIYMSLH